MTSTQDLLALAEAAQGEKAVCVPAFFGASPAVPHLNAFYRAADPKRIADLCRDNAGLVSSINEVLHDSQQLAGEVLALKFERDDLAAEVARLKTRGCSYPDGCDEPSCKNFKGSE